MTAEAAHEIVAAECERRGHTWGKGEPFRQPENTPPQLEAYFHKMYLGDGAWLTRSQTLSFYDMRAQTPYPLRRKRAA